MYDLKGIFLGYPVIKKGKQTRKLIYWSNSESLMFNKEGILCQLALLSVYTKYKHKEVPKYGGFT